MAKKAPSGYKQLPGEKQKNEKDVNPWELYKDQEDPDIFSFLSLAEDGGFSEVAKMYSSGRWAGAIMLVVFVLYNLFALCQQDFSFIWDAEDALEEMGGTDKTLLDPFYLSKGISSFIVRKVKADPDATVSPVVVLGYLELIGLLQYFYVLLMVLIHSRQDSFKKWSYLQTFCWDSMPALSSYSAMKLLYHIVPTVAVTRLTAFLSEIQEATKEDRRRTPLIVLRMLGWVIGTCFCFIVGFDTFLMKLRVVAVKAQDTETSVANVLPCIQFLIQLLGVVQLGPFVRQRLFSFIFGGEDGVMQNEEVELMEVWLALLARRIHRDLKGSQRWLVMLTFSDEDFQSLVLNEEAAKRADPFDKESAFSPPTAKGKRRKEDKTPAAPVVKPRGNQACGAECAIH